MENKQEILNDLTHIYQKTYAGEDMESMNLDHDGFVTVTFRNGATQKINCACDSGAAMIKDVASHLRIF